MELKVHEHKHYVGGSHQFKDGAYLDDSYQYTQDLKDGMHPFFLFKRVHKQHYNLDRVYEHVVWPHIPQPISLLMILDSLDDVLFFTGKDLVTLCPDQFLKLSLN